MRKMKLFTGILLVLAVLLACSCAASADTLTLPAALQVIGEEAFYGDTSLDEVILPQGIVSIGARAFAGSSIRSVYLPSSLTSIAADAFDNVPVTFHAQCEKDSYAAAFCAQHRLPYSVPGERDYILLGETMETEIAVPGETKLFRLNPQASGTFVMFTTGGYDTFGYLYDANMNELTSNDDGSGTLNFRISWNMTAGETYYLGIRFYSADTTGAFQVTFDEVRGLVSADFASDSSFRISVGDSVTMAVSAVMNGGTPTYQWYDTVKHNENDGSYYYEEIEIPEETGSALTVDSITSTKRFVCIVSDTFGSHEERLDFTVTIENHLSVRPVNDNTVHINSDGSADLAVIASCDAGELSYVWSYEEQVVEDGNSYWRTVLIPDQNGPSIRVENAVPETNYYCRVTDQYDTMQTIHFSVTIDNQLTASAATETQFLVNPHDSVTMAVNASCSQGEISYRWAYIAYEPGTNSYWEQTIGENSASLTITDMTSAGDYFCFVSDDYGNKETVGFNVEIDNGLWLSRVGDYEQYVDFGGTAVLTVEGGCEEGALTYLWFKMEPVNEEYGTSYHETIIPGETSASITLTNITKSREYTCRAMDSFGNRRSVSFRVTTNNGLWIDTEAPQIYVTIGQSAELSVTAGCNDGSVTFQWYNREKHVEDNGREWWSREPITGATGATYTVQNVTESQQYECEALDEYGGSVSCFITVSPENHFIAERVGDAQRNVGPGGTVTLEVAASADTGDISYQWYMNRVEETPDGAYPVTRILEGETGSSVTIVVDKSCGVYCKVQDIYGTIINVWFHLNAENNLSAEAATDQIVSAEPNEEITMSVTASCGSGSIHYRWTKDGQDIGVTTADCTVTVDSAANYVCWVSDDYGSQQQVSFTVNVDNGLTASVAGNTWLRLKTDESATLAVEASCNVGSLTYRWVNRYYNDGWQEEDIPGANSAEYFVSGITSNQEYICYVSDEYGGEISVHFTVNLNTELTSWALTPETVTIPLGGGATMRVGGSVSVGEVHFQWYDADSNQIEGATTPELTVSSLTQSGHYHCNISDDYGSSTSRSFDLNIENHLTITPLCDTWLYVLENTSATLSVSVSCDQGDVTYRWRNWDDWNATLSTEAQCVTKNITERIAYYCEITDQYGTTVRQQFDVLPTTEMQANRSGPADYKVALGDTVTLGVDVVNPEGLALTYQWSIAPNVTYSYSGYGYSSNPIEGATQPTCTVTVDHFQPVSCEVTDENGNCRYIHYTITVQNHLTAEAEQDTSLTVHSGDSLSLSVTANADVAGFNYTWVRLYEEDQSYGGRDVQIGEGAAITVENITKNAIYECIVTDIYNNDARVKYTVKVAE